MNQLSLESGIYFRDRIRAARTEVSADSEAFTSALFVLEEIGRFFAPNALGLGQYGSKIGAALKLPNRAEFLQLWTVVSRARNDAMHAGACARHLAWNSIRLLGTIEDGIKDLVMSEPSGVRVEHIMVRSPICAEPWMAVGEVRRLMLAHSYSTLPTLLDGKWYLVTDEGLAHYVAGTEASAARVYKPSKKADGKATTKGEVVNEARRGCLARTIGQAIHLADEPLKLVEARVVQESNILADFIGEDTGKTMRYPALVVRKRSSADVSAPAASDIIGIVSAYDLL